MVQVVSVAILASQAKSGGDEVPELFVAISPEITADDANKSTLLRSRFVLVNETLYESLRYDSAELGSSICLSLFDDFKPVLSLDDSHAGQILYGWDEQTSPTEAAGYRWQGRLAYDNGSAMIAAFGETLEAQLYTSFGKRYVVAPYAGSIYLIEEHEVISEAFCGSIDDEFDIGGLPESESGGNSEMFGGGGSCEETCDTGDTIHILVAYTNRAKQAATGSCSQSSDAIHCRIIEAIGAANQAYANSKIEWNQVSLRLQLVGMVEVDYDDLNTNVCTDLARLRDSGDGAMDEIHRVRDYLNADLVALITNSQNCFGSAAVGYIMKSNARDFEQSAFCVMRVPFINVGSSFTFAHEVGHNLGCAHDRDTEVCEDDCDFDCTDFHGPYQYSFGYRFLADFVGRYTIMAYPGNGFNNIVQHFSNPNVNFLGAPTGLAGCDYSCDPTCSGCPTTCSCDCDSADNARTINQTRPTAAKFRRGCDSTGTIVSSCNYLTNPITLGNGNSDAPRMSYNGQRIIFTSTATNFATDANSATDVFLFNRESGSVRPVSRVFNVRTETANAGSAGGCIAGGGFWVAFESTATNLLKTHGNTTVKHIYSSSVIDLKSVRVSVDTCGADADDDCYAASLSFSGRHVAFVSEASNLDSNVGTGEQHVYVRDRDVDGNRRYDEIAASCAGTQSKTELASLNSSGTKGNGFSSSPMISGDGRFVVFESLATNLDAQTSDTNGYCDIYVRRLESAPNGCSTDATVRISKVGTTQANGHSYSPAISHDGRFIVYASDASNLVSGDSIGKRDIFLHDRDTDEDGCFDESNQVSTIRVSIETGSSGTQGNDHSDRPHISADGRYVVFHSRATNFDSAIGAGTVGIFVRDVINEETYRVSINSSGAAANGSCSNPSGSDDGRYFAFDSVATNLDANDTNSYSDIFLRDQGRLVFGDLNGDLQVDHDDYELLLQAWGKCLCCAADLNGDGYVDEIDYDLLGGE